MRADPHSGCIKPEAFASLQEELLGLEAELEQVRANQGSQPGERSVLSTPAADLHAECIPKSEHIALRDALDAAVAARDALQAQLDDRAAMDLAEGDAAASRRPPEAQRGIADGVEVAEAALRADLAAAETSRNAATARVLQLEAELLEARRGAEGFRSAAEGLSAANGDLRAAVAAAADLRGANDRLREQLTAAGGERDRAERERAQLQAAVELLNAEIADVRLKNEDLGRTVSVVGFVLLRFRVRLFSFLLVPKLSLAPVKKMSLGRHTTLRIVMTCYNFHCSGRMGWVEDFGHKP